MPDDLAVVGVDDDDLLCDLSRPPLSSVRVPSDRIGFDAAALLDRLLAGRRPPAAARLLPPAGVAVRQSSDLLAVDDPAVREVLRAIRGAGRRPLQVADAVRGLDISRRSAERRFRAVVGRGIAAEIRRARVDRAKDLLAGTGLSVAEVADRAGFPTPQRFAVAFRRDAGLTPTAYRARHGPGRVGRPVPGPGGEVP